MTMLDGAVLECATPKDIDGFFALVEEKGELLRQSKVTDTLAFTSGSYSVHLVRSVNPDYLEVVGLKYPEDATPADLDALVESFSMLACPVDGRPVIALMFRTPDSRMRQALINQKFSSHSYRSHFMMKGAENLRRDRFPKPEKVDGT